MYNDQQKLESSFLEFPLLLKYKGDRLNNVRPYVIGGFNYRYDLAGKKEFDDQNRSIYGLNVLIFIMKWGPVWIFISHILNFPLNLKMSNGFGNVLVNEAAPGHPEYYNAIEKMKSQIWVLAFHFE